MIFRGNFGADFLGLNVVGILGNLGCFFLLFLGAIWGCFFGLVFWVVFDLLRDEEGRFLALLFYFSALSFSIFQFILWNAVFYLVFGSFCWGLFNLLLVFLCYCYFNNNVCFRLFSFLSTDSPKMKMSLVGLY